jgi:hypothetical protein
MEKILKTTPDGTEREHIVIQFTRVVRASENFYPLIDYINFKGEGTNPNEAAMDRETGRRQGWGLKQVLLKMNGVTGDPKAVRAEFADAAQFVLQQRVRNLPSNRVFEVGWLRRVATYHRPIADLGIEPKRALRKSLRVTRLNSFLRRVQFLRLREAACPATLSGHRGLPSLTSAFGPLDTRSETEHAELLLADQVGRVDRLRLAEIGDRLGAAAQHFMGEAAVVVGLDIGRTNWIACVKSVIARLLSPFATQAFAAGVESVEVLGVYRDRPVIVGDRVSRSCAAP